MFEHNYKRFHSESDGFINPHWYYTNMYWNEKIERLAKTSVDRIEFSLVAHDARDESTRHGLEAVAQRWAV